MHAKAEIPRDQFPRNLLAEDVANMSRGNRACQTSDEDAIRGSLRGCQQQVVRVEPVEFGERHDTRTNGQHYTAADRRLTSTK